MAHVVSWLDSALTSQPGTLRVPWGVAAHWLRQPAATPDPPPIQRGEAAPTWVLAQATSRSSCLDGKPLPIRSAKSRGHEHSPHRYAHIADALNWSLFPACSAVRKLDTQM